MNCVDERIMYVNILEIYIVVTVKIIGLTIKLLIDKYVSANELPEPLKSSEIIQHVNHVTLKTCANI